MFLLYFLLTDLKLMLFDLSVPFEYSAQIIFLKLNILSIHQLSSNRKEQPGHSTKRMSPDDPNLIFGWNIPLTDGMEIISLFPSFTVHPSPVSLYLEFSLPPSISVALYTHRHECSPEMTTKVVLLFPVR